MNVGDRVTLKIDRLSYDGGRGVGRHNGLVVFVTGAAPEETVEAVITKTKKNFAEAAVWRVIEASPYRREAPCPVFGRCGGCTWQHITYDEQLRQKEGILRHTLRNQGDYAFEMVAAPNEFRYRNRVQIHVENGAFGFYEASSRKLVRISDCLLCEPHLLEGFMPPRPTGTFEITSVGDGHREVRQIDDTGPQFSQVNSRQNEVLQKTVVDFAKQSGCKPAEIYDLYCGSGNLSFSLLEAMPKARLVGVESSRRAVTKATASAQALKVTDRCQFIESDCLAHLRAMKPPADEWLMVLDPPRPGLGPAVCAEILRLSPTAIVAISCNLGTLGRDMDELNAKYKLVAARGIDMFPQTEYLETVCLLC